MTNEEKSVLQGLLENLSASKTTITKPKENVSSMKETLGLIQFFGEFDTVFVQGKDRPSLWDRLKSAVADWLRDVADELEGKDPGDDGDSDDGSK